MQISDPENSFLVGNACILTRVMYVGTHLKTKELSERWQLGQAGQTVQAAGDCRGRFGVHLITWATSNNFALLAHAFQA